jgi:DNA repair protein RadC
VALAKNQREKNMVTERMSSAELLGLLIGRATPRKSAEMVALGLLEEFDGIGGLGQIGFSQLKNIVGLSSAGAARIVAAYELVNRIMVSSRSCKKKISDALDVWNLLGHEMKFLRHEEFRVLLLGGRNELLKVRKIASGQRDSCIVHSSDVFREALLEKACSIILVHNHPSGDPSPSPEDCAMTRKVVSGGTLIGISVLDHIIIGNEGYSSLREEGLIS